MLVLIIADQMFNDSLSCSNKYNYCCSVLFYQIQLLFCVVLTNTTAVFAQIMYSAFNSPRIFVGNIEKVSNIPLALNWSAYCFELKRSFT